MNRVVHEFGYDGWDRCLPGVDGMDGLRARLARHLKTTGRRFLVVSLSICCAFPSAGMSSRIDTNRLAPEGFVEERQGVPCIMSYDFNVQG